MIFKCYRNTLSRIDNRLVGDSDDAHGIVDGIVGVFGKGNATGGDDYRTARHVHGVETYLGA